MSAPAVDPAAAFEPREVSTWLQGVYLVVNAVRDLWLLVEAPDCVLRKTQFVQGDNDLLSTLTTVMGPGRVLATNVGPEHLVGSREPSLQRVLARLLEVDEVAAVAITSLPMAYVTGTDYERICREAAGRARRPVVHVRGGSLSGDWLDGWAETLLALARTLPLEAGAPDAGRVALVGHPFERNEGDAQANVAELRRLLAGLGLELASAWPEGGPVSALAAAGRAGTVVSMPYARRAAAALARRTGARLVECDLPFGADATERWVRAIAQALGLGAAAEALVRREREELRERLAPAEPLLVGRRWGFVGDPHLARGVAELARGCAGRLAWAVATNRQGHAAGLRAQLGETTPLLTEPHEGDYHRFLLDPARHETDLVVGTGRAVSHLTTIRPGHFALLELGFPVSLTHALAQRPFLGFRGHAAFVDRAVHVLVQDALEQRLRAR